MEASDDDEICRLPAAGPTRMSGSGLTAGIVGAMRHLADRQRVVAHNLANADTPGFTAQELKRPDFGAMLRDGGQGDVAAPQVMLSPAMQALGARASSPAMLIADPDTSETKPDGNNVTIEDQLLKMGQIQADFTTLTNLYAKKMKLVKTAIGRGV